MKGTTHRSHPGASPPYEGWKTVCSLAVLRGALLEFGDTLRKQKRAAHSFKNDLLSHLLYARCCAGAGKEIRWLRQGSYASDEASIKAMLLFRSSFRVLQMGTISNSWCHPWFGGIVRNVLKIPLWVSQPCWDVGHLNVFLPKENGWHRICEPPKTNLLHNLFFFPLAEYSPMRSQTGNTRTAYAKVTSVSKH